MRKYLILPFFLLIFVSCVKETERWEEDLFIAPEQVQQEGVPVVPGIALVKFDEEMTAQMEAGQVMTRSSVYHPVWDELGVKSARRLYPYDEKYEVRARREGLHRWYVLEFDEKLPFTKAEDSFRSIPGVEIVESRPVLKRTKFNDPEFSYQWGLHKGLGTDIQVEEVWEKYTTGSPRVIVSVIDEGVQLDHPDLQWNVLPAGPEGSKNFITMEYDMDPGDHGSHVAGIIAATNNNATGVCGIAGGDYKNHRPGVKIMSCEILKTIQVGHHSETIGASAGPAFKWAADHGAVISQNSWGYAFDVDENGRIDPQELEDAKNFTIPESDKEGIDYFIKYAGCDNDGNQLITSPMKGGVVIFAAGNDNIPYGPPADYEPVIAVGSMSPNGHKSDYSNYGKWVDLAAPGYDIYSTYSSGEYGYMSGTSMACPHVSGVAALVLSYRGGHGFTNDMLKDCLLKGANKKGVPESEQIGPLVNALGAVTYGLDNVAGVPANPEFTISALSNNIDFEWTLTTSPKGNLAYSHMLLAAKEKALLEDINPNDLPRNVVSREIIIHPGNKVGDVMRERMDRLDFNTDYYVTVIAMGSGRVYDGKYEIKKIRTQENHPPVIQLEPVGNTCLYAYEHKLLKMHFSDPEDNRIFVNCLPLDGEIEFEPLDSSGNYYLVIKAETFEPGKYELVLRVTDEYGMKTEKTIPFEILPNRPPQLVKTSEEWYADGPGEEKCFPLQDYFMDPDHEPLRYEIEISDESLVHKRFDGSNLYLTILKFGLAQVKVRAMDAKGLSAEMTVDILLRSDTDQIDIYPNPVVDHLYVRTGKEILPTQVEIYSGLGKKIYEGEGTSNAFHPLKLNVSALAPGRYRVKVRYGQSEEVTSMLKR